MSDLLHILVVDDEPKMRLGISRALRDFTVEIPEFQRTVQFAIDTVETGEAALAFFQDQKVDILLLDHKLPGIQGLDVLQRVTEEKRDMVVVMVTAYASIATAVSAGKQGAFDFLAKPFTPHELKDTVEKATVHLMFQRQARQLEREKHQMRFQLISVVAHELKSPLNAIDSYLQILTDKSLELERSKVDHVIERSLIRLDGMRKLINDLLDLTRIESGMRQRKLATVDIVKAAQQPLESAIQLGLADGITIVATMPPSLTLEADEAELEIILNNLLSNAVKYNKPNGRVDLTIADKADKVVIKVADTGIGMTQADADRLFNDFVRIKTKQTRTIPGSGLGLSIVRKLATLYGGSASVQTAPDVGSTFTVTLTKKLG